MMVKSRDGARLGRVVKVTDDGLLVEKGWLFTRDYLVPFGDVAAVQGDELLLAVARDRLAPSEAEEVTRAFAAPRHSSAGELEGGLGLSPRDLETDPSAPKTRY